MRCAWVVGVLLAVCVFVAADGKDKPVHFTTLDEFRNNVLSTSSPVVLVLYDTSNVEQVRQVWEPFLADFAAAMRGYGTLVAGTSLDSAVAREVRESYQLPNAPGILLFNGIHEPVPGHDAAVTKTPQPYVGDFDRLAIMRWVLASLDVDAIERIDDEADLADFFAKFPRYPALPHVLYLTSADVVSPLYRVLSQELHADAAFGVVVEALSTPERRAVAGRYNITAAWQLPALLVLHRQDGAIVVDEVHRMDNLTVNTTLPAIVDFVLHELPDSSQRVFEEAERTGNTAPLAALQERKMYMVHELHRTRAIYAGDDAPAVRLVTTDAAWRTGCVEVRKGHYCLVAFAESGGSGASYAMGVLTAAMTTLTTRLPRVDPGLWHAVVLDAVQARDIMSYFDAGLNGLPDVVLLAKASPNVVHHYVGAFTADAVAEFCRQRSATETAAAGHPFVTRRVPALHERNVPSGKDADAADL